MRIACFAVMLAAMSVYVTAAIHRAFGTEKPKRTPKAVSWVLSALPAAAGLAFFPLTGSVLAAIVALAHLTGLLVMCDILFCFVPTRTAGRNRARAAAYAAAVGLCAAYITYGVVNAFTVTPTIYALTTAKDIGRDSLRIVQISDCHLGTTFDGEGFARHIEVISSRQPDMLVITGDLADNGTDPADMLTACEALAEVTAPLGVYYVPGNHENRMGYDKSVQLYDALAAAGVVVLEDETVAVDESILLCGRADAYDRSRMSAEALLEPQDSSLYTIVLDHQPREYDAYAALGADLVLSGHSHAGQMFPLGMFIEFIGMGENTYGMETRGGSSFIVSSGLSGLLPIRTEAKSEYVIIDITTTNE